MNQVVNANQTAALNQLAVRNTRLADAEAVAACITEVAREERYLTVIDGFSVDETRAYIRIVQQNNGVHMVMTDADAVVGWCDLSPYVFPVIKHSARLGIGIARDYRGKKLGAMLLNDALNQSRELGIERVELDVFAHNANAIQLYRRFGFVEEGCKRRAGKLHNAYFDIITMAKWNQ